MNTAHTTFLRSLALLALLMAPLSASAGAGGTVSGSFYFFQNQGNFCPSTRDCTGARYLQSQYQTSMPVADIKVYVQRASDGTLIGQGTTDASGNFSMSWYDANATTSTQAQVFWRGEHKDNRFVIRTASGGTYLFPLGVNFTLQANQTTSIGSWVWGSSTSPSALVNLYDGARRMWSVSLAQSNRMAAYVSNIEVRAFDSATCSTSCADGPNNRIVMDDNSAYSPQGRILHEMGHIASYRASRNQNYRQAGQLTCYPDSSATNCGWLLNSAEWAGVAFEEGVATFLGDVALYAPYAVAPHTCLSSGSCGTNVINNVESSGGTACYTDDNRRPINNIRYFWDIYDSRADFPADTLNRGMWEVVDIINAFDNGVDNRQKDEVWSFVSWVGQYGEVYSFWWVDDVDGRSAIDFRENWINWGTNSTDVLSNNCGSAGD
jgi:hypothetical protein